MADWIEFPDSRYSIATSEDHLLCTWTNPNDAPTNPPWVNGSTTYKQEVTGSSTANPPTWSGILATLTTGTTVHPYNVSVGNAGPPVAIGYKRVWVIGCDKVIAGLTFYDAETFNPTIYISRSGEWHELDTSTGPTFYDVPAN